DADVEVSAWATLSHTDSSPAETPSRESCPRDVMRPARAMSRNVARALKSLWRGGALMVHGGPPMLRSSLHALGRSVLLVALVQLVGGGCDRGGEPKHPLEPVKDAGAAAA